MGFALAEEAAAPRRRGDRRRRQRRAAAHARRALRRRRAPPPSSRAPATSAFAACDVLLMAAAVADFRPRERGATASSRRTGARRTRRSSSSATRGRPRRARRPRAGPARSLVGFAAEHGDGRARATGATSSRARASTPSSSTTSARAGIGFDAADNEVTIVTAGGERHVPRATKAEVARAILDAVVELRVRQRTARSALMEPASDTAGPASAVADAEIAAAGALGAAHRRQHRAARSRCAPRSLEHVARRAARRGPRPHRGLPGRRQDRARPRASRARSTAQFARVQCTADLLPADVVGTNVYNQREERFEFRPGPIFANVVLVDEINRASPKTQSGPARVHAGAPRHRRRPHARAGAPVPRARDPEPGRVRGHLPAARGAGRPLHGAARRSAIPTPAAEAGDARAPTRRGDRVRRARAGRRPPPRCWPPRTPPRRVHASDALRDYVVALLRPHARGPRASSSAPARAPACCCCAPPRPARCSQGRDHALPDDVQALADAVLAHRIVLAPEARGRRRASEIVADALAATPAL